MAASKSYDGLIRVSKVGERDADGEQFYTVNDQTDGITGDAKRRGGRVGKLLTRLDQSGGTVLAEVGAELVERVRTGKSKGVIVGYSDRLCRNASQGFAFLDAMAEVGGEIWDATMPTIDYRTSEGRMIWGMKMVINEMPRLDAIKRGNRFAAEHLADGIANRERYGYRFNGQVDKGGVIVKALPDRHGKVLVPVEPQATVVRRIFKLRDAHTPWAAIATALDAERIPGPTGGIWTVPTLRSIVSNPAYKGWLTSGEREPNEKAHEAIVSRALWDRVQSNRSVHRNGNLVAGIAGGLLRCGTCGNQLSVISGGTNGKGERLDPNYGCRSRRASGKCSRPVAVSKRRADAFVEARIIDILSASDGIDVVASAREIEDARLAMEDAADTRAAFADRVDQLDPDDFDRIYAKRKATEKDAADHYHDLVSRADDAHELLPADVSVWRSYDAEHKALLAGRLVESIEVLPALSRSPKAVVEDRFNVMLVGGAKFARGDWSIAA